MDRLKFKYKIEKLYISTWQDYGIIKRMTWHLFGTIKILYIWYIYIYMYVSYFLSLHLHISCPSICFFFFFNLCKKEVNSIVSTKYERDCNVHMTPNSILDYLISPHSNATNVFFFFWHFQFHKFCTFDFEDGRKIRMYYKMGNLFT